MVPGLRIIRLISLLSLMLLLAFLSSYYLRYFTKETPYFLRLHYESSIDSTAQVFFDTGNGFNQGESCTQPVYSSNSSREIHFPIPLKKIDLLRLDPVTREGEFHIQDAAVVRHGKKDGNYEVLRNINLRSFQPTNDLALYLSAEGLLLKTVDNAHDPISEIVLDQPLDHSSMVDFIDSEFLSQALLVFILISPILLVAAYPWYSLGKDSLIILHGGKRINLKKGKIFLRKPAECYRDIPEETLTRIKSRISRGENWQNVLKDSFESSSNWLYQITTSDSRNKFLEERKPDPNDVVLDIGAGWGQFSIPLAKSNKLCALEPTPERLEFIKAVAEQEQVDQNMFFVGTDYLDTGFETKFDLILCIGVLEWVGSFRDDAEPSELQLSFLKKARQELNFGGRMVIGIENRIGLKYLMGAPDDHTGLAHISYLEYDSARKKHREKTKEELRCFTYGMEEYKKMLTESGFTKIQFFAALPDYKLPVKIFPIEKNECSLNQFILDGNIIKEHNGLDGKGLPNQSSLDLNYKSLASMNVAHHFAPSFYVEAS
jgi:2-polyprenyl-3-methyl-5-hydroxy-6-metoxy-1,4-benzoquinol methylase